MSKLTVTTTKKSKTVPPATPHPLDVSAMTTTQLRQHLQVGLKQAQAGQTESAEKTFAHLYPKC